MIASATSPSVQPNSTRLPAKGTSPQPICVTLKAYSSHAVAPMIASDTTAFTSPTSMMDAPNSGR